jgi:hypothetical protein
VDSDFFPIALNAFKSNIKGLPSFCRLTMLELFSYCNMTTGDITIDSLEELARDAFQVTPAPGRKKEDINGDTLRNALRSIKKAKPDCFIFSVVNQHIVIEMPFMRALYEQFKAKGQEDAAVDAREVARPKTHASIGEESDLLPNLSVEVAEEDAAATFAIRNNNKTNITKLTNITGNVVVNFTPRKQPISADFYPDSETIAEALSLGFERVTDKDEIAAFIQHNQARNTQWANFNPVYLQWLSRGAEYKQRQQQSIEQRSNHYGYHGMQGARKTPLELVIEQNPDAVSPSGESYEQYKINAISSDNTEHGLVVDGINELIRCALYEQERCEAQRCMV